MRRLRKYPGESRTYYAIFTRLLVGGAVLESAPTVTATGLTISEEAIVDVELSISGRTIPINEGVSFRVEGGTAGTVVTLTISAVDSLGNTLVIEGEIEIL